MGDNDRASTSQLNPTRFVPHLVRSLSKAQPTTQQTTSVEGRKQAAPESSSTRWISKQKTTAVGHFAKLRQSPKGQGSPEPSSVEPAERRNTGTEVTEPTEGPSHDIPPATPADTLAECGDTLRNESIATPESPSTPMTPNTLAKRLQDILYTMPSFPSPFSSSSPLPNPSLPTPPETEVQATPVPARDSSFFAFLPSPSLPSSPLSQSWESVQSALDHIRPSFPKRSEAPTSPEAGQDAVLDCIDDNNSIMMYGPLEPDDSSEVEIAHSEIISVNGDGEEIRTPQPSYIPLPSENFDENEWVGYGSPGGMFTPRLRIVPLPPTSIDQVLMGRSGWGEMEAQSGFPPGSPGPLSPGPLSPGPLSPGPLSPGLPSPGLHSPGLHSPGFHSPGLPPPGLPSPGPSSPDLPPTDKPPVKEYRVWLPSLTMISVQTMWWGFRIYLPPPVLDVLNNKQLEAAKRAALITTALQWLMDHLPISLLPPQVRPGVVILRHLVPYVGYMGGFIAWSWSAIRSFDKGYGVVLTATWLLPIALIPGTWEADEFPTSQTDPQPSSSAPTS